MSEELEDQKKKIEEIVANLQYEMNVYFEMQVHSGYSTEVKESGMSLQGHKVIDDGGEFGILHGLIVHETDKAFLVKRPGDGLVSWVAKSNIKVIKDDRIEFLKGKEWAIEKMTWMEEVKK